jgi:hypothetical protein
MKVAITLLAVLATLAAANPIISLEKRRYAEGETCYQKSCCAPMECRVWSYIRNSIRLLTLIYCSTLSPVKCSLNVEDIGELSPTFLFINMFKGRLCRNQGHFSRCMEFSNRVSARPTKWEDSYIYHVFRPIEKFEEYKIPLALWKARLLHNRCNDIGIVGALGTLKLITSVAYKIVHNPPKNNWQTIKPTLWSLPLI